MSVALKSIDWQTVYPMDFYANDSLGAWTNNNEAHRPVRAKRSKPVIISTMEDSGKVVTKVDNTEIDPGKTEPKVCCSASKPQAVNHDQCSIGLSTERTRADPGICEETARPDGSAGEILYLADACCNKS
ncbi:hypothetical protein DPMN_018397 [Dreissena polymorpha]|uniref:Uncharacterized protein n=2 Tax=Dreissena polymorpha TaxID=45954 RepID=A0A9D4S892_DREPO|nr:hypothetical protein DPMN_018397 [Dreissena polymorpha]